MPLNDQFLPLPPDPPRLRVLETSTGPILIVDRADTDLVTGINEDRRDTENGPYSDRPAAPPIVAFACEIDIPAVDPTPARPIYRSDMHVEPTDLDAVAARVDREDHTTGRAL